MNRIFISYRWGDRKSDEDFIGVVNAVEQSTGLSAFWDTRELRSGNFIDELQKDVRSADIFMPVVTDNYIRFGTEGGRAEDKDFCLMEYAAAVFANKKIVPVFCGVEGNIKAVSYDAAKASAERVLNLSYTSDDAAVLQKYLCSQNGVTIGSVDEKQISKNAGRLCSVVFDTFCSGENDISFFKEYLEKLAERLDPIRVFGDFDDSGLTIGNSYVSLSFLRHMTKPEKEEKEEKKGKEEKKESTAPADDGEDDLLTGLGKERLAVIVGDAGQGKSSFVKHLTIKLAKQAQKNGLSRDLFFPLYLECKGIERDTMSSFDKFRIELAEKTGLGRPALDAVIRFGKPLFIFDAMDEVPPDHMDALTEAIYKHIYSANKNTYILFTSRPGQRLVAGNDDMTLDNNSAIVRKYSVKEFNIEQRDMYISNLAFAKKTAAKDRDEFIQAIEKKEAVIADYSSVSRNPFMLFAIFSTYTSGHDLPENRFDAISRVIDDIVERDLKKQDYSPINKKNIKEILGAVSCLFYRQRDVGKTPHASTQTPYDIAEKIYHLDDSDRDDRRLLHKYSEFFGKSRLIDENGFRHDFLASTYAAYYLLFLMRSKVKKELSPLEVNDISSLKKDTDYWKGVTEALLCLIDRESEDSKTYIEPLIDELQSAETPDYDTLCSAVSQFVNHQPRAAALLLSGMLKRGCDGIENVEQTDSGFVCRKGINPYEELFYYPAIYPCLQKYLPNLTAGNKQDRELYLCSELIREVCALFSDDYHQRLRNVYNSRSSSPYPDIVKKSADAADRSGRNIRGYVRIRDGVTEIKAGEFERCTGLTGITIPHGVTKIGEEEFAGCTGLRNITIPDSVTEIGFEAFYGCTSLNSITIPNNLKEIQNSTFSYCTGLTDLTIPDSVTKIGMGAFIDCTGLRNITISGSVTEIIQGVFYGCTGLTGITISDGVTKIESNAFDGCTGLTSITIPDSVTEIEAWAFSRCTGLTDINVSNNNPNYSLIDGVLFNKEKTAIIMFPAGKTGEYTIPTGVTEIGEYAFASCTEITSITIPDSVTEIGEGAFKECTGLTDVIIPYGVTGIGYNAFRDCTGLTSITIPDSVTVIRGSAFKGCTGLRNITIPDSVTEIGVGAFLDCTRLTSITIPDSVTYIVAEAFENCTELTDVTIPDSVKEIGDSTFEYCTGLDQINLCYDYPDYSSIDGVLFNKEKTEIIKFPEGKMGEYTIPDSVKRIHSDAFRYCRGLTGITIPDSVRIIGSGAFKGCTGLTDINVGDNNPDYSSIDGVLFNKEKTAIIKFPAEKTGEYTIPDSVTKIREEAFEGCTGLTSITIPDGVTEIGRGAFAGCTGLTSVTIPYSVTEIGSMAFNGCTGLTDVIIPDSVTEIRDYAFCGCTGLTSITIPDSVKYIFEGAFEGCTGLTDITIDSMREIWGVFDDCPIRIIHGIKGSYAEEYAVLNDIPFVAE